MEITRTRSITLLKPVSCSGARPVLAHDSVGMNCVRNRSKLHWCTSTSSAVDNDLRSTKRRDFVSIHAASNATDETTSTEEDGQRWLLEPVGNGDSRHIGFKVALPEAFEIASSVVTVGRVPDKADIVIPVATVSGEHARIENKGGKLLVTDLDSTNGTFINEKRLAPGVTTILPPWKIHYIWGYQSCHFSGFKAGQIFNFGSSYNGRTSSNGGELNLIPNPPFY